MWAKIDATCSNTTEMLKKQTEMRQFRSLVATNCYKTREDGLQRLLAYPAAKQAHETTRTSAWMRVIRRLRGGRSRDRAAVVRGCQRKMYALGRLGAEPKISSGLGNILRPMDVCLCEHANYTYMKELRTLLLLPMKNMVRGLVIQCTAYECDAVRKACKQIGWIDYEPSATNINITDAVFPVTQGGHLIPVSPILDPPRLFTLVLYILELLIHLPEQTLGVFQRAFKCCRNDVLRQDGVEPDFLFDTFDAHSHLHRLNTVHVEVDVFNDVSAALRQRPRPSPLPRRFLSVLNHDDFCRVRHPSH
ncbi:hypothetical protein IW261DRAFT_1425717 [Armillaria novae-zelandiae]|uniref:Uncharacterized protein n=1 Tax=Armillaria novae-zelandiae TaxID=153914 RepID=A0AA39TZA3_9AGAR|nr:hypothetical protein IW261DRAFT_1425717 [Armillaria novae-zelandiae]